MRFSFSFEGTLEEFQALLNTGHKTRRARTQPASNTSVGGGLAEGAMDIGATGPQAPVGVNGKVQELPTPVNSTWSKKDLPKLKPEQRQAAWQKFSEVVALWTKNFAQTHEVTRELKTAIRNEEGTLVDLEGNPIPRGMKACYKVTPTKVTEPKPQPDRQKALASLGEGPFILPILVMAYEIGSLQQLVECALKEMEDSGYEAWKPFADEGHSEWLDYVEQISNTMAQVSHACLPDLAGTLDYSSKWRRRT